MGGLVNADMGLALLYFCETSVSFCSLMRHTFRPVMQSDSPIAVPTSC